MFPVLNAIPDDESLYLGAFTEFCRSCLPGSSLPPSFQQIVHNHTAVHRQVGPGITSDRGTARESRPQTGGPLVWELEASQPQRGFTTKPGVAGLRRTPGTGPRNVQNPEGVPQHGHHSLMRYRHNELWNPVGVQIAGQPFLGCAVVTATPGFVVKPRWG